MGQILVRNLDDAVIKRLKSRAQTHGRSLEAEVRLILEQNARLDPQRFWEAADRFKKQLEATDTAFSDSAELIREDRDR